MANFELPWLVTSFRYGSIDVHMIKSDSEFYHEPDLTIWQDGRVLRVEPYHHDVWIDSDEEEEHPLSVSIYAQVVYELVAGFLFQEAGNPASLDQNGRPIDLDRVNRRIALIYNSRLPKPYGCCQTISKYHSLGLSPPNPRLPGVRQPVCAWCLENHLSEGAARLINIGRHLGCHCRICQKFYGDPFHEINAVDKEDYLQAKDVQ
ncbi:MAG: hypothetical protein ACYCOU_03135 [Sulfobacillus sp.]